MRILLSLLVCGLCLLNLALPAKADSSPARQVLEVSVSRILDYIKNPGYADSATRAGLNEQIKKEVYTTFDFDEFAMRTAGPRWRTFSDAEKKAFSEAFASLLFATYLNSVSGYNGETVQYVGEAANAKKTRVEIRTVITLTGGRKVPVAYRMLPSDGTWRVYDVLVEGISLVQNYRSQFSAILANDSPQTLTQRILERAAALKEENNETK